MQMSDKVMAPQEQPVPETQPTQDSDKIVDSIGVSQEAHQPRPLKLRPCADCGQGLGGRELTEVTVEHESFS